MAYEGSKPELSGHGEEFGHELVSESVSEADSDKRFFETSDWDKGSDIDSDTHQKQDAELHKLQVLCIVR